MTATVYQQINLYQPIFRQQRQIFSAITMLQIAGVFVVALLCVYFYGVWQVLGLEAEAAQLEARETAYAAQLARLDPSQSLQHRRDIERELAELNAELEHQQRLTSVLRESPLGRTDGFSTQLVALARRHETGLWLTELTINGSRRAIELVGQTIDAALIPAYLQSLGEEAALAGHRFDEFDLERDSSAEGITFRVSSHAVQRSNQHLEVAQR
jgi:hypothetical protein